MADVQHDAKAVARFLHDEGAVEAKAAPSFMEIKEQLNLTRLTLSAAERYLLDEGYVERSGTGPTRSFWLTETGREWAASQAEASEQPAA